MTTSPPLPSRRALPARAVPARGAAAVAALLLGALVALVVPSTAGAATAGTGLAWVRVAHALAGGPAVSATVAGQTLGDRIAFGSASEYRQVPAGSHRVEVRAAGGDASAAALLGTDVDLPADGATTVVVSGTAQAPEAIVVRDDLTAPTAGTAKVRLVHAAPGEDPVWARTRVGERLYAGTGYATASAYEELPGGTYDIEMLRAGTENVLQVLRGVAVQPGTVNTLVGVGGGGQPLGLVALQDAVGTGTAPRGGVATGAGGTAVGAGVGGPAGVGAPAVLAALLVVAAAGTWTRSVRRLG